MNTGAQHAGERQIGRYVLYGEIASGGMATVHFGRLIGPVGFSRTVAIKRLYPQFARDPEFVAMFLDEARLAARVQHPNVVSTIDVVALENELFLVMDYVQGESISRVSRVLLRSGRVYPPRIAATIITGALLGLHAAHEAVSEDGSPLGIVHRDVSPQNILVGIDGNARVLDFGVAKAAVRAQTTREGQIKGKIAYMAPEQLRGMPIDRRADIYGASVVLWEMLTMRRLFDGEHEAVILGQVIEGKISPPSAIVPDLPPELDAVVMRGLALDPNDRFATARDMAAALEDAIGQCSAQKVSEWLLEVAGPSLSRKAEKIKEIESRKSAVSVAAAGALAPLPLAPAGIEDGPSFAPISTADIHSQIYSTPQRSGRTRSVLFALAMLLVGGAVAAFLFSIRSGPSSAELDAASAPEPPAAPSASHAPAPTAAPSASEAPAPTTTPSASVAPAPTTAPQAKSLPKSPRPTSTTPKPAPAKAGCNPPYTVDARGIRRIKPECL